MEVFPNNIIPWCNIWVRPRETIRKIVSINPEYQVVLLAFLAGFATALEQAFDKGLGDKLPILLLLVILVVFGPIGGILAVYIGGALFRWTGKSFGGRATTMQVRAAIAWSSVPKICTLILWPLYMVIYGGEIFSSEAPITTAKIASNSAESLFNVFLAGITLLEMIALIWSLIIFISCLSEVHRFSNWRAAAAVAVPFLALLPLMMGFVMLTGR